MTSSVSSPACALRCVRYPSCKEDAPQVIRIGIKIPVSQFLADCLFDAVSINQLLDVVSVRRFRLASKSPDNVIAARIYPVILWFRHTPIAQVATVINHIPRTVYAQTAEQITVIPFLNCAMLV